jgi:hypothetical protein
VIFRSIGAISMSLLGLVSGCRCDTGTAQSSPPAPSASALPAPSASASASAPPKLIDLAPRAPATSKVGDYAWTVRPSSEDRVSFGIHEIAAVEGHKLTVWNMIKLVGVLSRDSASPKIEDVPASFATLARGFEAIKVKPKDFVIANVVAFGPALAHVDAIEGKYGRFTYIREDKTAAGEDEWAEPLRAGIAPFAFGAFPFAGQKRRCLIVAVHDDRAFGIDDTRHLIVAAKSDVRPLVFALKPRKAGDTVVVFEPQKTGSAVSGVIEREVNPPWTYDVKADGQTMRVGFDRIVDTL